MSFLEYNNKHLYESQRPLTKRDPVVYWPSEASAIVNEKLWGTCHRQVFWKVKGVAPTNPMGVDMSRRCLMGKGFEAEEIKLTKENPEFVECNNNYKIKGELIPGIIISGEIDNLVKHKSGETRIIEYKSGSGWWYRKDVFPSAYNPGMPKEYYILQVMLYLELVKKIDELKHIDTAEIHCLDRDKCLICAHILQLDPEGFVIINDTKMGYLGIKNIADRFLRINQFVTENVIPPPDFRPYIDLNTGRQMKIKGEITKNQLQKWKDQGYGSDIQCQYCGYYDKCKYVEGYNDSAY